VNAYIATAKKNNDTATATMLKKEYLWSHLYST
jgi:hypothetical protein